MRRNSQIKTYEVERIIEKKYLLRIKNIQEAINASKAAGRFDLEKLLESDEKLLDVGYQRKVQLFVGTNNDFKYINEYLLEKYKTATKNEKNEIDEILIVLWHFRILQDIQNDEKKKLNFLKNNFLYEVSFYHNTDFYEKNDFDSYTMMSDLFSLYESPVLNKEGKRELVNKHINCLSKKQQLVIKETLNCYTQKDICNKYKMSKTSVSNLYVKAVEKLINLINKEEINDDTDLES